MGDEGNRRIVVLVEEVDAARSALQWAVQNLIRYGDSITLLHVYPCSRSKNKQKERTRRLRGFQLALSFKELCQAVPEAKVEIIVTAGDQGITVMSLVEEIRASTLVLGLHDQSFIHKTAMVNRCINNLNCKVLAVKQPPSKVPGGLGNAEFSRIETCNFQHQRRQSFHVFPTSLGMMWRRSRR